jgi:phage head maturation protease
VPELRRDWPGELVVRAGDAGADRVIEGIVVPFGRVASVRDTPGGPVYREVIAQGATDGLVPTDVLLESGARATPGRLHEGFPLVGRGVAGEAIPAGHRLAFRVSRTAAGDELHELARDGVLTQMSVVMEPIESRTRSDGVVERTRINVRRVAVLERGAYGADAPVTAVRAAQEGNMPANDQAAAPAQTEDTTDDTTDQAATPSTPAPAGGDRPNRTRVTVDVERAQAERAAEAQRATAERGTVDEFTRSAPRAGIGAIVTRAQAVYGPTSEHQFLRDGFLAARGDGAAYERQARHQAHMADVALALERATSWDGIQLARAGEVLSSEIPGAYPNEYLPGLLTPRILKGRPMGAFYDRFPISDARPRIFPKVTTSSTVAVQSAEGAALSATDFATTAVTATPLMYGAFTDVSRQAIDGGDPAAQQMILQDLIEAYSQASETVIKTAVEAGSTASGVAITAATPYAGAIANVVNFYGVRFSPAQAAFIPPAAFSTLLAQADTTGRPLVPQLGVVNSDGTVNVGSQITAPLLSAQGTLSWASTVNVWVFGVPSDFVIYESSIAQFSYDQPVGPQAVRIGIWAYLVVGTRLGSLKVTAA